MTIKPEVLAAVYLIADPESTGNQIIESEKTILTELTRLSEIADTVDPLVVRLGEVTTRLERADALLREFAEAVIKTGFKMPAPNSWTPVFVEMAQQAQRRASEIKSHLSEPRT